VRDGDNENSTLIGRFCGDPSRIPDPIISSFNYLWFNFVTDGSVQNRGFKLNYTTQQSVCGGILSGSDHGIIRSPLSPDRYPHGNIFTQVFTLSVYFLSLFLSYSLSNSNPISLALSYSASLCISLFFFFFVYYLSMCLSICLFVSLLLYHSVFILTHLSNYLLSL